ncbi:hypothetical protein BH20ACT2_BH20ACT2_21850 [soil metagenome]
MSSRWRAAIVAVAVNALAISLALSPAVAQAPPAPSRGYVLDGWGGVHPYGGAPRLATSSYWPGWDIARGLAISADGLGGYVLDG